MKQSARKLKVYRTSAGFYDAYVAAPTQKAAVEAWGADPRTFARGDAEIVTDPELTAEPLAHPGKVIRKKRGGLAEQLAALGPPPPGKRRAREPDPEPQGQPAPKKASPRSKPKPKPSREALAKAEQALQSFTAAAKQETEALREQEAAIARQRRELEQRQAAARAKLERGLAAAQERYDQALERWRQAFDRA